MKKTLKYIGIVMALALLLGQLMLIAIFGAVAIAILLSLVP